MYIDILTIIIIFPTPLVLALFGAAASLLLCSFCFFVFVINIRYKMYLRMYYKYKSLYCIVNMGSFVDQMILCYFCKPQELHAMYFVGMLALGIILFNEILYFFGKMPPPLKHCPHINAAAHSIPTYNKYHPHINAVTTSELQKVL